MDQNTLLFMIKLSSYLEKYFDEQPEHTVQFAVSHLQWPLVTAENVLNVFTNCHGPRCCSRVATSVFGKLNRDLEYVIFIKISVTSKNVINLNPYVRTNIPKSTSRLHIIRKPETDW